MADNADNASTDLQFGDRLREAREKQGLEIIELADSLHLDVSLLQSLEASDVESMSPTYVQGYIRAYSKALGIDGDSILLDYHEAIGGDVSIRLQPRSPLPVETSSESPVIRVATVFITITVILGALFAVYSYYDGKMSSPGSDGAGRTIALPPQVDTGAKQNALMSDDGDLIALDEQPVRETAHIDSSNGAVSVTVNGQKDRVEDDGSPAASDEQIEEQRVGALAPDKLELIAYSESWAEISDADGTRLYYDLLTADDSVELLGRAPFDIFLGSATSVIVVINRVEVDLDPYINRKNNTARFELSEKSGQVNIGR